MIIKIQKRENPFAQISHEVLEDDRISWRAKGILCYLLSKPASWWVRSEDILKKGKEGRDAVRAAMQELKDAGYATLVNTPSGRQWIITEIPGHEPCPEKPSMAPCPEKPTPEKANVGKSAPSNKDGNSNKEGREKEALTLSSEPEKKTKTFTPPTLDQVKTEMEKRGLNGASATEAQAFIDHHEARGWVMKGNLKMKSWPAAVGTWVANHRKFNPVPESRTEQPKTDHFARWPEFIASYPDDFVRQKCQNPKSLPMGYTNLKTEFNVWLTTGKYPELTHD